MLRREVIKMGGGLFGLGKPQPSRFPYPGRPQPSPGVAPSQGIVVRANRVIVTGPNGGIFVYSGLPASGNLTESLGITASTTRDPSGLNAVLPGDTRYHNNGTTFVAQQSTQSYVAYLWQATSALGPYTATSTFVGFTNEFTAAPILELSANQAGGYIKADDAIVLVPIAAGPGSAVGPALYAPNTGLSVAQQLTSGLSGFLPAVQTDTTPVTVTQAAFNNLTHAFTIPANDAKAGTVYRLTCGGYGTMAATTAVNLTTQYKAFGQVFASSIQAAAGVPAGATFHWEFEGKLVIITTGATGTARATAKFGWSQAATGGTNSVWEAGNTTSVDVTIDTTTATAAALQAQWASITNAPTITSIWSMFERLGT